MRDHFIFLVYASTSIRFCVNIFVCLYVACSSGDWFVHTPYRRSAPPSLNQPLHAYRFVLLSSSICSFYCLLVRLSVRSSICLTIRLPIGLSVFISLSDIFVCLSNCKYLFRYKISSRSIYRYFKLCIDTSISLESMTALIFSST